MLKATLDCGAKNALESIFFPRVVLSREVEWHMKGENRISNQDIA